MLKLKSIFLIFSLCLFCFHSFVYAADSDSDAKKAETQAEKTMEESSDTTDDKESKSDDESKTDDEEEEDDGDEEPDCD